MREKKMALKTTKDLFSEKPDIHPEIYAYIDDNPKYKGLLKIGYTTIGVEKRVVQQYPTKRPGERPWKIVFEESAMRSDGSSFDDYDIHKYLKKKGVRNKGGEWFECSIDQLKAAVLALKTGIENEEDRTQSYKLRPEQKEAIRKTVHYFKRYKKDTKRTPHFLWNAKMRFGKTFASYKLAQEMGWKKILVLTFKPAVENSWEDDLMSHIDFEGWQFVSKHNGIKPESLNKKKPFICFGSFQDYLGKSEIGGIKIKNKWVHKTKWDCVIFDEYHYGAWRELARGLFDEEREYLTQDDETVDEEVDEQETVDYLEKTIPIKTKAYLYLSGTPFRAILSGEFIEEQIFHWTYTDEQRAKGTWKGKDNPYLSLPKMVLLTYQLQDSIMHVVSD